MTIGTTSRTVSNEKLTATHNHYVPQIRKLHEREYPFSMRAIKGAKKITGGRAIDTGYEYGDHSDPVRVQSGFEQYNKTARPTHVAGLEHLAYVAQAAFITRKDLDENRGAAQRVNLQKSRIENVEHAFMRSIRRVALRGAASGGTYGGVPGWEDFLTFNGIDNADGFLENAAYGSQSNTVHGLSKLTYATTGRWNNWYQDAANAAGTNLLLALHQLLILRKRYNKGGKLRWNFSEAAYGHLKTKIQPQEFYVGKDNDAGREIATYSNIPIEIEDELPNTGTTTTAQPMSVFLEDETEWEMVCQAGNIMDWTPWADVPGTVGAKASVCSLHGQFTVKTLTPFGIITRAETY